MTFAIPRGALVVLYTLGRLPPKGATYTGLAYALGIQTERGVLKAVARARDFGLVTVVRTGTGRGAKAVIRVSTQGAALLSTLKGSR